MSGGGNETGGWLMKRLLTTLVILTGLIGSAGAVWADDFDKGGAAYEAGDYAEAAKWWRKAAEQGDAYAQYNLGLMYAKGEGVTQDDVEAVKWYRKAADQGLAEAQYNLGLMSEKDKGGTQDSAKAVKAEKINPKNQGEPDSKEAVKAVQSALKALGYDSGRIDGDFGPQTKRAYAAWREARGYSGDASKGEVTALMEEADRGGPHMENPGLEIEPKAGVGMENLLYCALGVLALLSSYYLNEIQACKIIGVAISTSGSETGFQNAISIPSSAKINLAIWALILGVLGYLVYEFGLAALGIGVLVCLGVGIFTSAIIPKPKSDHFLKRIYASMARRHADYEKTNDTLRANAMSDLLRKVENTYKERFAHFT
jgi:peptidoglycan hydrolase-like protein with peptidoglycan-binding domain